MERDRWELLRKCADFKEVYDHIFNEYGVEEYESVLDKIEKELEDYENSTDDEWQSVVEQGNVPDSVLWFVGMIDTEYFLNECWL